jgi:hypothetical protein
VEEITLWGASLRVVIIKYYFGDQVEKNGVDGTRGTFGGTGEVRTGF